MVRGESPLGKILTADGASRMVPCERVLLLALEFIMPLRNAILPDLAKSWPFAKAPSQPAADCVRYRREPLIQRPS